jgi:hypothetical protein
MRKSHVKVFPSGAIVFVLIILGGVFPSMAQALSLTINFGGSGTGRVEGSSDVPGTDPFNIFTSQTINYDLVQPPSTVVLTAFPTGLGASQSTFGGWTGCASTSGTQCTVVMSADQTVAVAFNLVPANVGPVVNAGPSQTITLPSTATLTGTVTDDGLPTPPGTVTSTWSKVSGPGTVTFANASAASTTASFSQAGTYVLQLTANDGALSTSANVTITVNPAPPQNQAPSVNAGPSQTITLPSTATLTGTVTDDGLPTPPGVVTSTWSKVSGPGTVTFANASAASTTASFSQAGTYVLRLTATDGELSRSSDLTITVTAIQRTLTVTKAGTGSGTVTSAPGGISCGGDCTETYANGTAVTLTAAAGTGSTFAGWSGGVGTCAGTTNPCAVTMTAARAVTATFTQSTQNQAPSVNAGPSQTITLPSTATLTGTVIDDGLPTPPGVVTTLWSKVSGPGTVTFANAGELSTTASFSQAGTYLLRLTATDGSLSKSANVTITVNPANQAPSVNAGPSQTITLPNTATLSGTITDDGLPTTPGTVTSTWSKVSGPGTVTFANAAAATTTTSFSQAGTYLLRLTATDGALSKSADVNITVNSKPVVTVPDARGTWAGTGSGTLGNCQNPIDNGSGTVPVTLVISNQTRASFSGSGSFSLDLDEGLFKINFSLSGILTPNGAFTASGPFESRRVSDNAFGGSGIGNFSGTLSNNNLVFSQFEGQTTIGDTCHLTATVSLTRNGPVPMPIIILMNAPNDLNADGTADLLWRNKQSGVVVAWLMNDAAIASTGVLAGVPMNWQIMGMGDVNADGQADVIWRNTTNGVVAVWLMDGLTITSVGFPGAASLSYVIKGIGDVDGNGTADIVWRDTLSGAVAIWLMNGPTIVSSGFPSGVPLEWEIAGMGDVNADGQADVIWRNTTNGVVAVWLMNGLTITSVGFPGAASLSYVIKEIGDVDGNGTDDIIWHDTLSRAVAIWLMNGPTVAFAGFPGGVPPEWEITGMGDVNADGKADLIWQNRASGAVALWLMNGQDVLRATFPSGASTDWEIQ